MKPEKDNGKKAVIFNIVFICILLGVVIALLVQCLTQTAG